MERLKDVLGTVEAAQDILRATDAIIDGYFEMLKDEPALQDLLNAIQADKEMLDLDIAQTRLQAIAFSAETQHLIADLHRENYSRSVYLLFSLRVGPCVWRSIRAEKRASGLRATSSGSCAGSLQSLTAVRD